MRQFILKTLLVGGLVGTWAAITLTEIGPAFGSHSERKPVVRETTPPSPTRKVIPPGRFGDEPRSLVPGEGDAKE